MKRLLWICCLCLLACARLTVAAETALPRPAELEPDVQFWIRVYSEISTNEGFIHDQHKLSVVYETMHFDGETPPHERAHRVDAERERVRAILLHLGRGDEPADADEKKVKQLWGDEGTPARFSQAAEDIRFQLGQSDRFRAGLVRAGAWETHIGEVLANLGLPAEIGALPHVESSFDPYAYSKVGAAGLWQFMRSTGRRFLRIDAAVDERMDPYRATEAAAQLLSYNYRLLGSWPLAITAYNHGAEGMRRAREQLGTDDIVRIVRSYHSPTFGFASRNFYVSFLAALTVSQSPDKYFGGLERSTESGFHELKMPSSATAVTLIRTLGVDRETLKGLNPALRPTVWNGQRMVPAGYVLRMPNSSSKWTTEMLAQRMGVPSQVTAPVATVTTLSDVQAQSTAPPVAPAVVASARSGKHGKKSGKGAPTMTAANPVAAAAAGETSTSADNAATVAASTQGTAQPGAAGSSSTPDQQDQQDQQYYVVQSGDTVESIAVRTRLTVKKLLGLNLMREDDDLYEGQRLRLVQQTPTPEVVATVEAAKAAVQESAEEDQAVKAAKKQASRTEVVSKAEAQAEGPELVPGATGSASVDPVDYSVGADNSIRIVAAETLGHYADWLGTSAQHLRTLNHLSGKTPMVIGRRLKLEFKRVTPEQFEQKRGDYHEQLEAAYFSGHRIEGTEVYIARRGDSLWSITQRASKVPVWLLQQYNPDLDFGNLRPGTQISLPKVEDVSGL